MQPDIVIRTRDELARLWLPWCVNASMPWVPLTDSPALQPNAAQLCITDLDTPVIRRALASQPYRHEFSWPKIESIASDYRALSARRETIIVDDDDDPSSHQQPTLMACGDAMMFCEGSHRSSALWASQPEDFELRLVITGQRWPGYDDPELRRRGRPFTERGG